MELFLLSAYSVLQDACVCVCVCVRENLLCRWYSSITSSCCTNSLKSPPSTHLLQHANDLFRFTSHVFFILSVCVCTRKIGGVSALYVIIYVTVLCVNLRLSVTAEMHLYRLGELYMHAD